MIEAPLTHYEPYRLEKLRQLGILDTPPEKYYDEIVAIAAELCGTNKAYVTLIDEHRQWIKAALGEEQSQSDRSIAFCAHTILGSEIMEVFDARADFRFFDNPNVTTDPNIRFYAGAPLTTEDGYNLGALCVISEEPKQLDDKQRYLLTILARAVVKEMELRSELNFRTRLEKELRQAKYEAQQAALAKSMFLSVMTHELRNPLNALLGFSNLLSVSPMPAESRELVDGIKISGNQLLYLVNDVLDYSKLEEGKVELHPESISLETYLNQILIAHKGNAQAKQIELKIKVDPSLPKVIKVDQHRLGQILNNLIGNAIKFTLKGYVELSVSLNTANAKRALVSFAVSDTGIGIKPEHQEAIFESYMQGDASTSKNFGGTGLGLSISSKLVELMGSKLNLNSEPGVGSVFYFTLGVELGELNNNQVTNLAGAIPVADFKGARILLADDLDLNRLVIKRFLQRWNIEVDEANDGKEAIDLFNKNQYDMVMLDLVMPNIDGFEAASIIKSKSGIPILALTGKSESEMTELINTKQFDGYVPKPFEPDELYDQLRLFLEKK